MLGVTEESHNNLTEVSWPQSQDLNPGSPKYEAGVPIGEW